MDKCFKKSGVKGKCDCLDTINKETFETLKDCDLTADSKGAKKLRDTCVTSNMKINHKF